MGGDPDQVVDVARFRLEREFPLGQAEDAVHRLGSLEATEASVVNRSLLKAQLPVKGAAPHLEPSVLSAVRKDLDDIRQRHLLQRALHSAAPRPSAAISRDGLAWSRRTGLVALLGHDGAEAFDDGRIECATRMLGKRVACIVGSALGPRGASFAVGQIDVALGNPENASAQRKLVPDETLRNPPSIEPLAAMADRIDHWLWKRGGTEQPKRDERGLPSLAAAMATARHLKGSHVRSGRDAEVVKVRGDDNALRLRGGELELLADSRTEAGHAG